MDPASLRTLGRSGLVVSPLALGTMTFGAARWGSPDDVSESIFNAYVDAGGNFIDTADVYAQGRSEELLGGYVAARGLRDRVVLATKYAFNAEPGNASAGGNGRKNLHRALDGSLRRLQTDYVDLYWMHVWDRVTPAAEVLQAMGDLVRAGKIRYFGLSNVPAWYAARVATLAQAHGVPGPVALQMEYSLTERTIEHEYVPAARELGLGITAWGPLAAGFLGGRYRRAAEGGAAPAATDEGRLSGPNPYGDLKFTDRNWRVLDALRPVAAEAGRPMAQVALAWAAARPGITALILGASRLDQLRDNLAALDVVLSPDQTAALDRASAPDPMFPYAIFSDAVNRGIFGGASVQGWR